MGLWQRLKELVSERGGYTEDRQLRRVQEIIGYTFHNVHLLALALTHRSVSHNGSNERLEFLGDSVLGLVIADQLYQDYPEKSEGDLTKMKAMLVNESTLASVGIESRLNRQVRLSPEEIRAGGRERASIIADAFEAIIGATYCDGGFGVARDVVLRLIYIHRDRITSDKSQRNYKGDLLEYIQARGEGMPRYEVVSERGPDHEKEFEIVVTVAGQKVGEGTGLSKKEAEQRAAAVALEHYLQKKQPR